MCASSRRGRRSLRSARVDASAFDIRTRSFRRRRLFALSWSTKKGFNGNCAGPDLSFTLNSARLETHRGTVGVESSGLGNPEVTANSREKFSVEPRALWDPGPCEEFFRNHHREGHISFEQRLADGIALIVVTAAREGEEFGLEIRQPIGPSRQKNLARLEFRRGDRHAARLIP